MQIMCSVLYINVYFVGLAGIAVTQRYFGFLVN